MANEQIKIDNLSRARDAILESMLECGIHKTTKDKISAMTGISMASIARYFPTKNDMILAAIARLDKRQTGLVFDRTGTGLEQIRNFFDKLIDDFFKYPQWYVFRLDLMCYSHYQDNDLIRRYANAIGYRKIILDLIKIGKQDGSVSDKLNLQNAADLCADLLFDRMSVTAVSERITDESTNYKIREFLEVSAKGVLYFLRTGASTGFLEMQEQKLYDNSMRVDE